MKSPAILLFLSLFAAAMATRAFAYVDMGPPASYYSNHDHFPFATATVGGPGGAALYQECKNFQGSFQFLRALETQSGNRIDAVGIECGRIEQSQGQLRFANPTADNPLAADRMWGGSGGGPVIVRCESYNEAVAGLRLQKSPNNFLGFVAPLCRALNDPGSPPHIYEESGGVGRISDKSSPWQDVVCPPGMFAIGINGGYGNFVDRLGLVCLPGPTIAKETLGAGMDDNTNRAWSDYAHFTLAKNSAAQCQSACVAQRDKCRAWAYVREDIQGPDPVCYLKSSVPPPVADTCCISGTTINSLSRITAPVGSLSVAPSPVRGDLAAREIGSVSRMQYTPPSSSTPPQQTGPAIGEPGGFAGPAPEMAGAFDSSFGALVLTKTDGTYTYKDGRVTITKIYGDFMDGTWSQSQSGQMCADGTYRGTFHFHFTKDGFTGSYRYCDGTVNAGPWNGTRR